ncbi:beta-ketoacyl synthase N-terminal-like domain-containing protein [Jejudonia soesokkakensis]|uniref:Beta-ketoacyl synthase N-terminal-like domain-containing protein n=1 Tax=Jejudonia soesokkakensis TaxID=1323432 RepID=A0ABW2MRS9_9FLAO
MNILWRSCKFAAKLQPLQHPISITHISSVSPLGSKTEDVWQSYRSGTSFFSEKHGVKVAALSKDLEVAIASLRKENHAYKNLDRAVLLALLAVKHPQIKEILPTERVGVNIGSSRGATSLFESYHKQFITENKVSPFTSPTTTTGNISSWVGQELGLDGISIDQSVTCSTAMHALLNGIAWLQADMADAFIVGGTEAALTPFTSAQMQAMKLYSKSPNKLACESMRFQKKKNTMILGEGAAIAVLERGVSEKTKAVVVGYGFASEALEHNSSISENADCFQKSMQRALTLAELETIDAIVMHAPGTVKGDKAEKNAIDIVFKNRLPLLTSNKWLVGHTFAASGILSIEMAILMLQHNKFIENPFFANARHLPKQLKTIMINAVGFGGNAVSIILQKPS